MYTIKREIGRVDNVRIGMIGDLGKPGASLGLPIKEAAIAP